MIPFLKRVIIEGENRTYWHPDPNVKRKISVGKVFETMLKDLTKE